jgi:23S rRNA pseudouridine1911/1915/1917 synthase
VSEPRDWVDASRDETGGARMVERTFVVEPELAGMRVDLFLKRKIPRLSRTKLQEIIRTQLTRRGRTLKPNSPVLAGDELILRREARPEPPCPRHFGVLYEDEEMMVIDKPAGLPMHVSAKFYFNTLTQVLRERYPDESLQICHRLDRETSGALVVARHREAAAHLKTAFAKKTTKKTYLAIVHGQPEWTETDIDLPLGLVEPRPGVITIRMVVRNDALPSRTHARVVSRHGEFALVSCRPITGRQHQIRAHLGAIGFPIVGDKLYAHGDEIFREYCRTGMTESLLRTCLLPRQALHAHSIEIPHPRTKEILAVESPLPADLREFLDEQTVRA